MIARLTRQVQAPTTAGPLGASLLAFLLIAASGRPGGLPALCGGNIVPAAALVMGRLQWLTFDPWRWSLDWLIMLCAMMLPLLVQPLDHIVRTTLKTRLVRSTAAFVAGYFAAWIPGAIVLGSVAAVLMVMLVPPVLVPTALVFALIWSASPIAQCARNRSHRFIPLEVRGTKADLGCLRFGLRTGLWCAAACWPWMLLCLVVPGRGVGVMLPVAAILLAERVMPPCSPRWQLPRLFAFLAALRPYRDLGRA